MIKKLRVKFIFYNMLIVMAVTTLLLGILTEYMQNSLVKDQYAMLHRIAEDPERRFRPGTDEEGNFYPPYFILEISRNGEFIINGDGSFDLSNEEELKTLYDQVLQTDVSEGVAEDYGLRYIRMETPWGAKLVFSDMAGERATMRRLIKTSILIGVGGCGIIFVISLLLSRWAVKPMDEAWRQQKQFVSDASHELKTPLTVIMANAELLTQPGYSDEQRRGFSESILSVSRQMR
ncbi:MAG: sensor histidine kinase, partial [Oscillospiraceae bacterium]|nr:sensor histidine kinase [Oscillospiraceae bacterium]